MFSRFIVLVLTFQLVTLLNQSLLAQAALVPGPDPRQSSRTISYKWSASDSDFAGDAVVTWMRTGACLTVANLEMTSYWPRGDRPTVVVNPRPTNGISFRDFTDPKAENSGLYSHNGHWYKCDARAQLAFDIVKGDTTGPGKGPEKRIILALEHICVDANCKDSDSPSVKCLLGPKGKVIMYNGKYLHRCKERY